MKTIIYLTILLSGISCSSFESYLINRSLDTSDVFTLGVERKVTGINIKPCFGNLGVQYAQKGSGIGLRSGNYGRYRTGKDREYYNSGNSFIILNSVHHHPENLNYRNNKNKSFQESNTIGIAIIDWEGYNFLTQCELSVGLYYGVRVGVNFAEFTDWFLGWFGLDILDDDKY